MAEPQHQSSAPDFIPAQAATPDFIPATPAKTEEPGFLDKDIPLAGPWYNPTLSGLQSIGRGVRGAVQGAGHLIAHPIDTAEQTYEGIKNIPSTLKEVPGAIRDINASPDPLTHYAKAAQDTAGEGAGQALVALGTEGLARAVPPAVSGAARIAKPAVRTGLRIASDVVDPDLTGVVSPRLAHVQRIAGRLADKMTPRPIYPGAHLPEAPAAPPVYPGAHLPEHPGDFPGAHLPETPPTEVLQARGLATGARPVPEPPSAALGRIAKPSAPAEAPAGSIAKPNGKAPSGDPLAKRLLGHMNRIQAEGHGDELPEPEEATPDTTNLNTDLTPALKASLARVRAAKAARIARPN